MVVIENGRCRVGGEREREGGGRERGGLGLGLAQGKEGAHSFGFVVGLGGRFGTKVWLANGNPHYFGSFQKLI